MNSSSSDEHDATDPQCSRGSSYASSSSTPDRTFKPYGYGQVFPSLSPRSSGAGDTEFEWTMAEEKILRDVAQWLSPADLRRARLVCQAWCGGLATLTTKAATPAETLVPQWKGQLEAMLQAFPCLQELTISSRLSSVAAQQLGVLATAKQLQVLNIPHAQAMQDRSLLALQPLAPHLRQLRVNGASSLGRRSLLLLSVLANLELLELKNCGKISWLELQQAWKAACMAHEAHSSADGTPSTAGTNSSGGGSGRFSSNGGFGSKLGSWLPGGRLFRTSSPSSNAIQSALSWQRTGTSSLFAKVHDIARGTGNAAAVAVAQLGIGAVGNGRSSCGGGMPEAPARSLLYRKQKEGAAAASGTQLVSSEDASGAVFGGPGAGCFPVRSSLLRMRASKSAITTTAASAAVAEEESRRPTSMLSRVGSLVWHSSSAASAGTDSSSFVGSSGSSIVAQASCVQAALLAYIEQQQEEQAAAAARAAATELLVPPPILEAPTAPEDQEAAPAPVDTSAGSSESPAGPVTSTAAAAASSGSIPQQGTPQSTAPGCDPASSSARGYKPRRRTTGERALPAMPFTKLANLSFTCSEVMLKSPGPELAAVAALTSLTALEISKCKLPDAVFAHLQSLGKLRKLKLTGLWSMGDAGLQHIAQLTSLQNLAVSEAMHVSTQGLQVLSSLTGLTGLALGFTQDLGPGALAQVVNSLPMLQCFEVAAPSWGDVDCEMLAEAAARAAAASCRAAGGTPRAVSPLPAAGGTPRAVSPLPAAAEDDASATADSEGSAGVSQFSAVPQMLWDLAGGSISRPSSRTSSKQFGQQAPRSSSPWGLRASSFNSFSSLRSRSFGSFSVAPAPQPSGPAPAPAAPLLVLKLHGCRALTSIGMAALKQLPELHTLVLENCKEVCAAEVISQGLLPPKLTALSLRSLPFGNLFSGCVSMPCCSGRLTKLELVSLEGAHEGQLRRVLSFFPNVSELSLAGCADLGDAAVPHLGLLPKLQQLNLSGSSIAGHTLEHLHVLSQLHTLKLRGCSQLTDAGLAHLPALPALEELDVAECGMVSEQALLYVAQSAARLVHMDVSGCKAVSRALLAACPDYLSLRHSL